MPLKPVSLYPVWSASTPTLHPKQFFLCLTPCTRVLQISFLDRVFEFIPSLMIMGLIYWMFRQQMRNLPGGMGGAGPLGRSAGRMSNGRGGSGGGGFFGMGKANVKEMDKNEVKVRVLTVLWFDLAQGGAGVIACSWEPAAYWFRDEHRRLCSFSPPPHPPTHTCR